MFPLGRVLFCGESLPLHVFETRYRELTRRCLDGDRRFGVVLIMRGTEVGTDADQERCDIGTVAEIVAAEQFDDGRWMLQSRGVERLRVRQWLPDDPYPCALVESWGDPPAAAGETDGPLGAVTAAYDRILSLLRAARPGGAAGRSRNCDSTGSAAIPSGPPTSCPRWRRWESWTVNACSPPPAPMSVSAYWPRCWRTSSRPCASSAAPANLTRPSNRQAARPNWRRPAEPSPRAGAIGAAGKLTSMESAVEDGAVPAGGLPADSEAAPSSGADPAEVLQELRDVVLAYFRQEAVDPLRRLAAWLGFGLAGGVFVCTGLVLLALAGLRALQTETGDHLTGSLSWTPYAIVLAAVVVVFLLARSAARARRRGTEEVAE